MESRRRGYDGRARPIVHSSSAHATTRQHAAEPSSVATGPAANEATAAVAAKPAAGPVAVPEAQQPFVPYLGCSKCYFSSNGCATCR